MKHTPYTTKTGLKIGCRYQENGIRMPVEGDMLLVQEAFLATPEYARSMRINRLTLKASVFIFFLIVCALMVIR